MRNHLKDSESKGDGLHLSPCQFLYRQNASLQDLGASASASASTSQFGNFPLKLHTIYVIMHVYIYIYISLEICDIRIIFSAIRDRPPRLRTVSRSKACRSRPSTAVSSRPGRCCYVNCTVRVAPWFMPFMKFIPFRPIMHHMCSF